MKRAVSGSGQEKAESEKPVGVRMRYPLCCVGDNRNMIKHLFSYATGGRVTAGRTEMCSEGLGPSRPHADNKICARTHPALR